MAVPDGKLCGVTGVAQMNLGILMSLFNQRYFRDSLSTWYALQTAQIYAVPDLPCTCVMHYDSFVDGATHPGS